MSKLCTRLDRLERAGGGAAQPERIIWQLVEPSPHGPVDTGERVIWERGEDGIICTYDMVGVND